MTKETRSLRRCFRFRLRTLLWLTIALGLVCGWIVAKRRQSARQTDAVTALTKMSPDNQARGWLRQREYEFVSIGRDVITYDSGPLGSRSRKVLMLPRWILEMTGEECFHHVTAVDLARCDVTDEDLLYLRSLHRIRVLNLDHTKITDDGISQIVHLRRIRCLCLGGTQVSNDALKKLNKLPKLQELELWYTAVNDEALGHLKSCERLERLNLCRTGVTRQGVVELQQALPNCRIWWDGDETFQLINACPTALGEDEPLPNPAALIRVVNHLYSLGKERAIAALLEYTRFAPGEQVEDSDPYDQTRLCLILPLLFERIHGKERIPDPPRRFGPQTTSADWPMFYISVDSDFPFHNAVFVARSGPPFPRRDYLVEWAAKKCRIRAQPLHPAGNAMAAALRVHKRLIEEKEGNGTVSHGYNAWLLEHLRSQASRMHASSPPTKVHKE